MATARTAAARALMAVSEQGGYSNLVLDNILDKEGLSVQDRSFCAALFYTTIQRLLTLDHAIATYTKGKTVSPAAHAVLRCGFCQLLYMPSIPQSAVVNEAVTSVRLLGEEQAAGFVNGVLRSFVRAGLAYPIPRDPMTALSIKHSVPMPLIGLWRRSYGHETAIAILEGLEAAPPLFVRVNTTRTTPQALVERLAGEGVTATISPEITNALVLDGISGRITSLASFGEGMYHVQDLSSQRCVEAAFSGGFAPQRVLDVCAAPGGKSFTAALLMNGGGSVTACDLYLSRCSLITEGSARLGLGSIATAVADATIYDPARGEFDLVLCDVVCSGFGISRRKPEIRYKALNSMDGLPSLQYNILNASAQYCCVGGRVVYSTCTLVPAENEQVVDKFLSEHPDWSTAVAPTTLLPTVGGGDGFFYTVLERNQ